MAKIVLKKKERYFLSDKFFLVVEGSVCAYDIFENGKFLPKEVCFRKGELVGNFFQCFPCKNLPLPETEVEVIAMSDNTVIEEFKFDAEDITTNLAFSKIIIQLLRENIFKLLYHLYDTKGYLMSVFKFYADEDGVLQKDEIRYENFLVSKSQFYAIYNELKNEKYIIERDKKIKLNLKKIDKYFKKEA